MTNRVKNLIVVFFVSVIVLSLFQNIRFTKIDPSVVNYSDFIVDVNNNRIYNTKINGNKIEVTRKDFKKYITYAPTHDSKLLDSLLKNHVTITGVASAKKSVFLSIFIAWFPAFLFVGVWFFCAKKIQSSIGQSTFLFGKSTAQSLSQEKDKVTFSNIAGCHEAIEEVSELVEYLKEPKRFKSLGGKMPTGILLVGPPGTGKTLLAKAIAGEANVPFFTISGSDFVEMFVGVGASRVRDMFKQSRKCAPCIIFIDEIDAVGRSRGLSFRHSNDEREQTLNQILVEMDGFKGNDGIIVIAATNRPDILDSALLRPGRFDRHITVPLPELLDREEILKMHMKKLSVADDVVPITIARSTSGFSGADLANLVNESALLAARFNKTKISMSEFEKAKDRITMGPEKKSRIISGLQKESIAYHESGHAIIGRLVPNHDLLHKVTIIPRGHTLGVTIFLPKDDLFNVSRQYLENQIAILYGGRLAEEIIYGSQNISTGSYSDIKTATQVARDMVTKWGFSDKLGPLLYVEAKKEDFSKKSSIKPRCISDATRRIIEQEIKLLIEVNYKRAEKMLKENIDILHAMKDALIKYETIESFQVDDLMARRSIRSSPGQST